MELLLGVDIGTGSTKGVLATPDGRVVATEQLMHQISLPRPGWAEVDAEATWWAEVQEICRRLGRADEVTGVCVSGVGPCLVLCDANLNPLRPAILYGIDTRASAEIDELTQLFGSEAIFASAGKRLTSQALGPKLQWVRRHEPDVWRRAHAWYGCHTYIAAKLTGEHVLDHHTASQSDPLYRVPDFGWHHDWAMQICEPMRLPRLAWPSEVIGTVHTTGAAATGLRVGTPVVAGTMDVLAEALSVGVRAPGDLMIMYGSTMFLMEVLAGYSVNPGLWTTVGVDAHTHMLAGGSATAGSLTTWLQTLVGGVDFDTLLAEAAAVPAGADSLLVLPYLAGERTPLFDPDARGLVAGLTLRHGRGHLVRACYEGIAFGIRHMLDLFNQADTPIARAVAVGGGLHSPLWIGALSDITNQTQLIPRQTIGACYGDALLAAIGTGLVPTETDWTEIERVISPNPANREVYDHLYGTWLELYPATVRQMHRLAAGHPTSDAARSSGGRQIST